MKIKVTYGSRTYGNSTPSQASEIHVTGSSKCFLKVDFKKSQRGRSWDWLTCGSVGGAEIEMSMGDAKALGKLLLEYAEVAEKHCPMEYDVSGLLRIRDGHSPKVKVVAEPYGT